MRSLLRYPGRRGTPKAAAAAPAPAPGPAPAATAAVCCEVIYQQDFDKVECGHEIRQRERVPRSGLDVSGHSFRKTMQAEIRRAKLRQQQQQQQQPTVFETADAYVFSLPRRVSECHHQHHHQPAFLEVPAADEDHIFNSAFGGGDAWRNVSAGQGQPPDDIKLSPRSRTSSVASTLPPSPSAAAVANITAAVARPHSESRPPLAPQTRSHGCGYGNNSRCLRLQQGAGKCFA